MIQIQRNRLKTIENEVILTLLNGVENTWNIKEVSRGDGKPEFWICIYDNTKEAFYPARINDRFTYDTFDDALAAAMDYSMKYGATQPKLHSNQQIKQEVSK